LLISDLIVWAFMLDAGAQRADLLLLSNPVT